MSTTVLAAGDHFVLPRLLTDEASGTEEELIEALRGRRICVTRMAPLTERVPRACPGLEPFRVSRGGPVNADPDAVAGVARLVSLEELLTRSRIPRGGPLAHCANPQAVPSHS